MNAGTDNAEEDVSRDEREDEQSSGDVSSEIVSKAWSSKAHNLLRKVVEGRKELDFTRYANSRA